MKTTFTVVMVGVSAFDIAPDYFVLLRHFFSISLPSYGVTNDIFCSRD